ncbi:MAG: phenylalanine--tRNA ligase subunit beta, partial [Erysipelotrichaceae bacterium]|nr:phenylalanine--tRNA ligase subunit beta [Erysipelotrichaceae bacterium]
VIKGIVLEILNTLGFEMGRFQLVEYKMDDRHFHPYQSAVLMMNNKPLCIFGKLHPTYLKSLKLGDVYYAEMILDDLAATNPGKVKAPIVSKYPAVSRDISLMLKDDVKAADLLATIKKAAGKLVKSSEVFDVYQGEHIEQGYKSVSLNIVYEDKEKTLKSEDVNDVHNKVVEELLNRFDAKQR